MELNSLFAILGLLLVMVAWGRTMLHEHLRLDALVLGQAHLLSFDPDQLVRWLSELFQRVLYALSPLLLVVVAIAVGSNAQSCSRQSGGRPLGRHQSKHYDFDLVCPERGDRCRCWSSNYPDISDGV